MEHKNSVQRVFVVGTGSFFEQGVASLLSFGTDLHVSGVTYTDDDSFLEDVAENRPDVILLNEAGPLNSARILELLSATRLASLRVIVVRPDSNAIDVYERPSLIAATMVYERQRIIATTSDDLIELVIGHHE